MKILHEIFHDTRLALCMILMKWILCICPIEGDGIVIITAIRDLCEKLVARYFIVSNR